MDGRAILQVDHVEQRVAAAEDEPAAINDCRRAVDGFLGLVAPDQLAVGGGEHARGAVVAVEQHPVGAGCRGAGGRLDGDGAGADLVLAGKIPRGRAGGGVEGVELAVVGGEKNFAGGDGGRGHDRVLGLEAPQFAAGVGGERVERALDRADEDAAIGDGGLGLDGAVGGEGPRGRGSGREFGRDAAAERGAAAGHGPGGLGDGGGGLRGGRFFFRAVAAGGEEGEAEEGEGEKGRAPPKSSARLQPAQERAERG